MHFQSFFFIYFFIYYFLFTSLKEDCPSAEMSKCPNEGRKAASKPQLMQDNKAPFGEEEYAHIRWECGRWFFPHVVSLNYLPLDRDIQIAMHWSEMSYLVAVQLTEIQHNLVLFASNCSLVGQ